MKKVLIVDNDEYVLLALERVIESEGYDTAVAIHEDDAFQLLAGRGFDLLVLDDYLSSKDCVEVLTELRRAGIAPMVVITYHRFPPPLLRERLRALGVRALIDKKAHGHLAYTVRHLLQSQLSPSSYDTMT